MKQKINMLFSVSICIPSLFFHQKHNNQRLKTEKRLLLNESVLQKYSSFFFFYCRPTQTCKCVDVRNLVLVRQCVAVTMATNLVHAHARPPLISLSALPGPTFIYQHPDMLSSWEWNNIPFLSQNTSCCNRQRAPHGHTGMMCVWSFFPILDKGSKAHTYACKGEFIDYTDHGLKDESWVAKTRDLTVLLD